MAQYHDDYDSDEQCLSDVKQGVHTPDSVRESAEEELRRRGYTKEQISEHW